jgi:hypothetical protein
VRGWLSGMVRRWATTRRTVHGVPVVVVNSRTDVETDTVLERRRPD